MLYENEDFKERELAALVASKVYYHLGSFDNALQYALGANKYFNVDESSEYVETIIGMNFVYNIKYFRFLIFDYGFFYDQLSQMY